MNENETSVDDNNEEIIEQVEDTEAADQDQDVEEQPQKSERELELEEQLQISNEKAARYKSERDRIKSKPAKTETNDESSNDLIEKAYLNSAGYKDIEEQEEILKVAKNLGLKADEAVNDPFVKARVEHLRKAKEVAEATPRNSKKKSSTKNDVQYWIDKGELPPADQTQLRRDVVNAKQQRAKTNNKFNN